MAIVYHEMQEVSGLMVRDQRIFTRIPFVHPVRWMNGQADGGAATLRNVSRSGFSLRLGRYLRPGPMLQLVFDDIDYLGEPVQLEALTVWSRADNANPNRFLAGFKVVHGEMRTLGAISEVFYRALRQNASDLKSRPA